MSMTFVAPPPRPGTRHGVGVFVVDDGLLDDLAQHQRRQRV